MTISQLIISLIKSLVRNGDKQIKSLKLVVKDDGTFQMLLDFQSGVVNDELSGIGF
jgi:hypothetical protein